MTTLAIYFHIDVVREGGEALEMVLKTVELGSVPPPEHIEIRIGALATRVRRVVYDLAHNAYDVYLDDLGLRSITERVVDDKDRFHNTETWQAIGGWGFETVVENLTDAGFQPADTGDPT